MRILEQSFGDPELDLAADEFLFAELERREVAPATLRIWEPQSTFVVLGRGSRCEQEVNLWACRDLGVPVLRRISGGATIVTGPGCLMYALILPWNQLASAGTAPSNPGIPRINHAILDPLASTLDAPSTRVLRQGTSDLAFAKHNDTPATWRKFSGNSLRVGRQGVLYHGTLLFDFDLSLIPALLPHPPREPAYRAQRGHLDFVGNFPSGKEQLHAALNATWPTTDILMSLAEVDFATWARSTTRRVA